VSLTIFICLNCMISLILYVSKIIVFSKEVIKNITRDDLSVTFGIVEKHNSRKNNLKQEPVLKQFQS
jgi:hypothetical protein